MNNDEILQQVAETIRETFGVDDIEITHESVADDIPGWDSLSHTILVLTIEQVFAIELPSSTSYRNVGDLVEVIAGKIDRQTPRSERPAPLASGSEAFADLGSKDVEIPHGNFVYPCRLTQTPEAQYLCVQLHGSVNRVTTPLPVFARWNWGKLLGAHVLAISDPTIAINDTLDIGWYLGNKDENAMDGVIAIARRCAETIGIAPERIIFSGSSGGGFAALQAAALLPDGKAIAINPQTDLLLHSVKRYVEQASGCTSLDEATRLFGDRWKAIDHLRNALAAGNAPRIVYVQNVNDYEHFNEHFTPFAKAFGLDLQAPNSVQNNFMSILYEGPEDHVAESSSEVKRITKEAIPFLLDIGIDSQVPDFSSEIHLHEKQITAVIHLLEGEESNYTYACYLLKNRKVVEKCFYQTSRTFNFQVSEPGKYMCRCFIRNKGRATFSSYSKIVEIDAVAVQ